MTDVLIAEELRVAAYAVCIRTEQILLVHWVARGEPNWTLPGGGLLHGEDPVDAVIREVAEETACTARVSRLLGVSSARNRYSRGWGRVADQHAVQVFYEAEIIGGTPCAADPAENDEVAWVPLGEVSTLPRSSQVDVAVDLWRHRPVTGRLG